MGKFTSYLKQNFFTIVIFAVIIFGAVFLVFNGLNSIPPGVSANEKVFIESSSKLSFIIKNPLNAPIKLPYLALTELGINTIVVYRAIAGIFGLIFIICFYRYTREYQTRRVTILATILLFTSSWFLQNTRLGLDYILLPLSILILLLATRKLIKANNTALFSVILGVVLGCTLYVPAVAPIFLLLAIFGLRSKAEKVKFRHLAIVVPSMLIVLIPLILATVQNPNLINNIFGIPTSLLPIEWAKRILVIPIFLFAKGPFSPINNLGRLPILDVFSSVLLILGVYAAYFKLKENHLRHVIIVLIASFVLIALNGEAVFALIMPIVYIIIAYGVALILQQWFTVFPKNPLVKNIGITLLVISLSFVSFYHLKRYFVAWPNSPATKAVFRSHLD